jgi:hypothetical protein
MTLQSYLTRKQAPPVPEVGVIETQAMRLLCRLHDETNKTKPDDGVVSNILQDLDVLVVDYRRGKSRT